MNGCIWCALMRDSLASDMQSAIDKSADTVDLSIIEEELEAAATAQAESSDILSPHMLGALDYVTQRYRVSPDALITVFETAQLIGQERQIDPLLIVAIIGIESRFNPFAESAMGARGLTRAVLCGELLAALVNAEPLPVDARLARAMGTERLEK